MGRLAEHGAQHVDFVERLVGLFDPRDPGRGDWRTRIRHVRERLADDHCYLAVLGEVSSGKSTFLNALVGAELFASHTRRTTGAAVRVSHGPRLRVLADFHDGRHWWTDTAPAGDWQRLRPAEEAIGEGLDSARISRLLDRMDARQALGVLTTDPTVAPRVAGVRVEFPSPLLADGLVLIDTPGTASEGEEGRRHSAVARAAVEEADAAVVVCRQDKFLASTLVDFLTDSLDEGLLARCAFVVTRADQAEDIEDLHEAAVGRVHECLAVRVPVLWTVPVMTVRALRGAEADPVWLDRFAQTVSFLHGLVSRYRPAAVADTVLRLVGGLLRDLEAGLVAEMADLERRRAELGALTPDDPDDLLADELGQAMIDLSATEEEAHREVDRAVARARGRAEKAISARIEACTTHDEVKRVAENELAPLVASALRDLAQERTATTDGVLRREVERARTRLDEAYLAAHTRLERIAPEVEQVPVRETYPAQGADVALAEDAFEGASTAARQGRFRDSASRTGVALAGAVIGGIVLPGLGAFVGGFIGTILAHTVFAPQISKVKERVTDGAVEAVGPLFGNVGGQLHGHVGRRARSARDELHRGVAHYRKAYLSTVDAVTDAQLTEHDRLERRRLALTGRREEAALRRADVAAERGRLREAADTTPIDHFGGKR